MTKRFSIRLLMAVVFLIAADFAIVRGLWPDSGPAVWPGVAVATLPTINLLILAAPKLRPGTAARPYWTAFEAIGMAMVLVIGFVSWFDIDFLFWPFDWANPWMRSLGREAQACAAVAFLASFATVLQLLPALLAASLSSRYRLAIVRR